VNDPFPASNHTYGALTYMPTVKRFWWQTSAKWFQGSAYPENGEYDPATHRFTYNARDPNNDWYPGAASTWDTTQRRCLFNGGFNLYAYDPAKPGGQKISIVRALPGSDTNQVHRSLYDPRRRRVVYCGVKRNATWSRPGISYCRIRENGTGDPFVDLPGNPTAVLAALGAPIGGPGPDIPGWLYHPILDKYVYYHGAGNTFYYIDPDTGVVTSETFVGPALPNTVGTGGTGWFLQYSPAQDIMILPKIDAGMMGPLPNGQLYGLRSGLSGSRT
jgi:hypothetical protein